MKINKYIFFIPLSLIIIYLLVSISIIVIKKGDLSSDLFETKITKINTDKNNAVNSYGYQLNEKYSSAFSPKFGNKYSKISIVFFLDFDCPYCFEEYVFIKNMLSKHLNDGYFEFRQFPLETIHPNSRTLSNAVMCANEQGKFLEMFDAIFLDYKNREKGETPVEDLINVYAKNSGLNEDSFNICMKALKYNKIINKDAVDALNFGLTGTPSFFVNGEKVEGIVKTEDWNKLFINNLK